MLAKLCYCHITNLLLDLIKKSTALTSWHVIQQNKNPHKNNWTEVENPFLTSNNLIHNAIPFSRLYKKFCINIIINYMHEGNSYTNSDSAKMSIETTFQLKRSGVSSTYVSVEVDFSPAVDSQPCDQQKSTGQTISRSIPIYNRDKNYFTPSFILEMDKNKYIENQHIYQTLFEKKIEQMDQQKTQLYLPKPSKTNSFCCVCKTFFDDYLTHVTLPMHKTLMQKSDYHLYIEQICGKFSHLTGEQVKHKKPRGRPPKTKQVQKEPKPRATKKSSINSLTKIPSYSEIGEQVQQC